MVDYPTAMRLPARTLLYLYEVRESLDLEGRAHRLDDNRAVAGTHSKEHHEALMRRIDALERLAAGERPPGYTGDTTERIEL